MARIMVKVSSIRAMLKNRAMRETLYSSAEYWDSKALEYNDKSISMWPNNHLNNYYHYEQTALLEKYLPNVAGVKILDVGCGTGRMSEYFAQRGASVLGIDFSAKSIEIAKKRAAGDNPSYRVQSVFDLDEVAAFDLVVSWGVLTVACKDRLELLDVMKKLYRSLKLDGKALLLEPIHRGFLHRVLNMNFEGFSRVMMEVGFKIDDITHMHFWPMRLVLAYLPWPRFFTAAGYHLGQAIMKLTGNKAWGDYQAICTSV
jgi:2-polyprenyl-3-methyl-5-hydroxy-6-metoxy-1,4-benzoquinol methylase